MRPRFLRILLPVLVLAALPAVCSAGVFVGVSVNVAPPPLPVYLQPPCPQPGYIWVPGYWAWGPYGYYWVPGTWVLPPEVGVLWTPGWWGWDADRDDYMWHAGYWGPQVGFYGGIDYGYGYDGDGFVGGYWNGGVFFYNRAVVRVGPGFDHDVYYHRFHRPERRYISFNGGRDGIRARPTHRDLMAEHQRRFGITRMQRRHEDMARGERVLRARFNHGRPPIAATARAVDFHGRGVVRARAAGGPVHFAHHAPMRHPAPVHHRAPARRTRTDRPPWATGQRPAVHQGFHGSARDHAHQFHGPGAARPTMHAPRFQSQPHRAPRPSDSRPAPRPHAFHRPPQMRRAPQHFRRPPQMRRPPQHFQRPPQIRRPAQHFQRPQGGRGEPRHFQGPRGDSGHGGAHHGR